MVPGQSQAFAMADCKATQDAIIKAGNTPKNGQCKDTSSSMAHALHADWIDPNGGGKSDAFVTWCDFTTDGGGWSIVYGVTLKLSERAHLFLF